VVIATTIIPPDGVWIFGCVPEIQVAIRMIVPIGLTVSCAPEPPSRVVCGPPCFLVTVPTVHRVFSAATAPILRAGDVNDEVGMSERASTLDEGLPICTACWREDLRAIRAAVLLRRPPRIMALGALHHGACAVRSIHSDAFAFTRFGAACLWGCGDLHDACALLGLLPLRDRWKRCKFSLLVRSC